MAENNVLDRDELWMKAYRKDDPDAFAKIYGTYGDAVYGYLVKRVRDAEERDDLFQKIWMKFHRSRDLWSPEYPLLQWIFVIARSVILDRFRATKRTPFGALVEDSEGALSRIQAPEEAKENSSADEKEERELVEEMRRAGLSEEQVEVVRRRIFSEEEYYQIANRIGKNAVSVRKIFSRAIEKIRLVRAEEGKR
jgi:RNA polymerase sigma factor (sigma-70 family)